jgi:hypothetical protein
MALRDLQDRACRSGSLFGAHPGSATVREDVDLIAPVLEDEMEAERATPPTGDTYDGASGRLMQF